MNKVFNQLIQALDNCAYYFDWWKLAVTEGGDHFFIWLNSQWASMNGYSVFSGYNHGQPWEN